MNEALDSIDWLIEIGYKMENISLCGDSAGAHLAASITHHLANENKEKQQNSIDTAQEDVKSVLGKRRKSIPSDLETDSTSKCANSTNVLSSNALKKRRVDSTDNSSCIKNQTNAANYQHQGKITEYLPEKKAFLENLCSQRNAIYKKSTSEASRRRYAPKPNIYIVQHKK